jgi:hypothetical protein
MHLSGQTNPGATVWPARILPGRKSHLGQGVNLPRPLHGLTPLMSPLNCIDLIELTGIPCDRLATKNRIEVYETMEHRSARGGVSLPSDRESTEYSICPDRGSQSTAHTVPVVGSQGPYRRHTESSQR